MQEWNCAANPQHFAVHHHHHVADTFRPLLSLLAPGVVTAPPFPRQGRGREDHPCEKVFRKRLHSPFEVWSHLWAGNGARWEVEMRRGGRGGEDDPYLSFFRAVGTPKRNTLLTEASVPHYSTCIRPTDVDSCGGGESASFNTRRRTRDSESEIHIFLIFSSLGRLVAAAVFRPSIRAKERGE